MSLSIVDELINNKNKDVLLIQALSKNGDDNTVVRIINFNLQSNNKRLSELFVAFINDNEYGIATHHGDNDLYHITVEVKGVTVRENILCISGFICSLAILFKMEFLGWGTEVEPY